MESTATSQGQTPVKSKRKASAKASLNGSTTESKQNFRYQSQEQSSEQVSGAVGSRIKYFAKRCYRTQNNFSDVIGIDAAQLSHYVSKGRMPGGEILFRFNQAGMSLDWLFNGGDDSMMFAQNEAGERLRTERAEFKEAVGNVQMLSPEAHDALTTTKVIKLDDYQNHLAMLQNFISFMRESAK